MIKFTDQKKLTVGTAIQFAKLLSSKLICKDLPYTCVSLHWKKKTTDAYFFWSKLSQNFKIQNIYFYCPWLLMEPPLIFHGALMFHGTLVGKHWFISSYRNVSAWQVSRPIGTTIIRLCFFWKRTHGSILLDSLNHVINSPTSLDWFIKFVTYISCRMHKLIPSNTLQLLLNGENTFLSF